MFENIEVLVDSGGAAESQPTPILNTPIVNSEVSEVEGLEAKLVAKLGGAKAAAMGMIAVLKNQYPDPAVYAEQLRKAVS